MVTPCQNNNRGTFEFGERAAPLAYGPAPFLVLLFSSFFAAALSRQRFFYALSFAGFQIERVTFHFLDYVLGLYLPFEPAKRVLEGFTLLKSDFSQLNYTPKLVLTGPVSYGKPCPPKSSRMCKNIPAQSKIQPHRHLNLAGSIRACRLHETRRLLIIRRIVRSPSWLRGF
jgi:hypothetical protein